MIKYKLICKSCNKSYDSWFSSSKEYEKLKKLKHINCLNCNSLEVNKNLMSPSIVNSKNEKNEKINIPGLFLRRDPWVPLNNKHHIE